MQKLFIRIRICLLVTLFFTTSRFAYASNVNEITKESFNLKPGIIRHIIKTKNDKGPVIANVLEIDLSKKNISVKVGLADKNKIKAKDTLLNIVENYMAYIGINANYFDVKVGNPLGVLITQGDWLTGSIYNRPAIGFTKDKNILINQVKLIGNVTVRRGFRKKPRSMFEIDGLNTPLNLYTNVGFFDSRWDSELTLPQNIYGAVIKKNRVKNVVQGLIKTSKGGYILVSHDNYSIKDNLIQKDRLDIKWQSSPDWSNIREAVSGGPYLIMDGQVYVDEAEEHFKFAKKDRRASRSAIGVDYKGKLYLIAVCGEKNGYSEGVTLTELADLLKNLNLKDAINLDGGGSTTLIVDGKIINELSQHHKRKITNGLLILYKE